MAHLFSFGFGSDDIEDSMDEMVDVRAPNQTPQDNLIAVMEPRLHKLQDLV